MNLSMTLGNGETCVGGLAAFLCNQVKSQLQRSDQTMTVRLCKRGQQIRNSLNSI